jgi:queuine tRNA-ribosyltransferase
LFKCEELLAYRLATIHNLRFMQRLVNDIRHAIASGSLSAFREEFRTRYRSTEESVRLSQKRTHRPMGARAARDTMEPQMPGEGDD